MSKTSRALLGPAITARAVRVVHVLAMIVTLTVAAGCSSSSTPPTPPTLFETWTTAAPEPPGAIPIVSGSMSVEFARLQGTPDSIGAVSATRTVTYGAQGMLAGCTEVDAMNGSFTTKGGTSSGTIQSNLVNGTISRTQCANTADNQSPRGFDYDASATSAALSGAFSFSADAKTLTIGTTVLTTE